MKAIGISEKKYKKYKDAKGTSVKDKGLSAQEKIKDILSKAKGQTVSYVDMASEGVSERAYTKYKVENNLLNVKNDKTPLFKMIDEIIASGNTSLSQIKTINPNFKQNWMTAYRDHYGYVGKFTNSELSEISERYSKSRSKKPKNRKNSIQTFFNFCNIKWITQACAIRFLFLFMFLFVLFQVN